MDTSAYLHDPRRFAGAVELDPLTLGAVFERNVSRRPNALAVVDEVSGERLTWRALDAQVRERVRLLQQAGVGKGDVIGLCARNGADFVVGHLAVAICGAVALLLHVAYTVRERSALLRRADASGLMIEDRFEASAESVHVEHSEAVEPGDPFVLAPTSGTESRPKICMHTHEGLLSNAAQVAREAAIGEHDVLLPASGFTHLFGLLGVHVATLSGAALVATGKFDAERCVDACVREAVTMLWAVPAQLVGIVTVAERTRATFPSLREIRTAGAPLSPALAASIARTFGVEPLVHWGMSEVGAGIVGGRPLAGAQVRVEAKDGELHYRRADMFRGYLNDRAATARAITSDGFLRTGDLATIDGDGRVSYAGRIKDVINRGGMKVSALELETELAALPEIRQLAVVPVASARLGERAALVCSLAPGASLTIDDVRAHLERRGLAKFKWPEYVLVVDELPLTPTGKVAKQAVRTLAAKAVG
jgi:cyclohexanecarboxylate-CoA ligase